LVRGLCSVHERAFALICVLVSCTFGAFAQSTAALEISPSEPSADISAHLVFSLDEGQSLGQQYARFKEGGFSDDLERAFEGAEPYQFLWAALDVTNATPDDGRVGDPWILTSQVYGIVGLEVFVAREIGLTETLLAYNARRSFSAEQFSGTRLRSSEFIIAPRETVTLMLKMSFGPVEDAAFTLETPVELQSKTFLSGISITAFYAFALSSLVFFLGFVLSMRSCSGVCYALTLLLGLGFLAYLDNFLFRFFYPDRPDLHLTVGLSGDSDVRREPHLSLLLVRSDGALARDDARAVRCLTVVLSAHGRAIGRRMAWRCAGSLGSDEVFFLSDRNMGDCQ